MLKVSLRILHLTCLSHLSYYQFAGQTVSYRSQGLKSCQLYDDDDNEGNDDDDSLLVSALTVLLPQPIFELIHILLSMVYFMKSILSKVM
jgi:hypothetical protein